jgi:hypothetical protein
MFKSVAVYGAVALMAVAATVGSADAARRPVTLAVTMTNDATSNEVKVYDAATHALLQTLPTFGKGGVSGNARGVKQYGRSIVAVVNSGSSTVAVFERDGDGLVFDRLVSTTSAPVSIDFGNGHMYVAGTATVDSFVMRGDHVGALDGTAPLALAGGGTPPDGSTAQVGVIDAGHLLVTLKTDPTPGTVDVVALEEGVVTGETPDAVAAPSASLTPFGFSVYPDGSALITLAHSSELGLFRDGAFAAVVAAGQTAPCWSTRVGKYVFTANTGSKTISRVLGTGSHIFIDQPVAGAVPTGAPSDIDADGIVLGVIDHGDGQSHLSLFAYNRFGELTANGSALTVGAPNANGVAIMPPAAH